MSRKITMSAVFPALLLGCSVPTGGTAGSSPNRVVLAGTKVGALLSQCSRSVPKIGESAWQPTDKDIDALEAALPTALSKSSERNANFGNLLSRWQRQYVGLVRGGRHFIYGNFFPISMTDAFPKWRTDPVLICDGGPAFFGAEFDVQAKRFTQLDFNGDA